MPGISLDSWAVSLFSLSIRLVLSVWECLCSKVRIRFGWIGGWEKMEFILIWLCCYYFSYYSIMMILYFPFIVTF